MGSVVEIHPLTRVEGHGSVKLFLDGTRAQRVELCLTESPRLFEALLVGRSYLELPEIICRICSLCSTVHKVTALVALEKAFGVEVSPVTRLTRELILEGGQLQSHALHLYCLVLPDLLEFSGLPELARQAPELLRTGLAIKELGNEIQEVVGGRLIHPVNLVPGGLGRRLRPDTLKRLRDRIEALLPACAQAYRLFLPPSAPSPLPVPGYLALRTGESPFCGERLETYDGHGFPVEQYREQISERVLSYSRAKEAEVSGNLPCVGALARLNVGSRLAPEPRGIFETLGGEILRRDMRSNSLAQAIELYQGALNARTLTERLLESGEEGEERVPVAPVAGSGCAALEAPRGVLIHSYTFDADGICTGGDVITPTSLNQGAISRDLLVLARSLEGAEPAALASALERLVRSYDPCISCAVHLVRL